MLPRIRTLLAPQVHRRLFSDLRKAREARRSRNTESSVRNKPSVTPFRVAVLLGVGAASYGVYDVNENPDGALGKIYYGSAVQSTMTALYKVTFGRFEEIFEPSSDALIPDWPTAPIYGNPPPGTPAPPLLVLDLEKTLVGSTYDARYGWRHVKRPVLHTCSPMFTCKHISTLLFTIHYNTLYTIHYTL